MNIAAYAAENSKQDSALEDDFTADRYLQFHRFLPLDARRILDVGCATGRGGVKLKELRPACELVGLDCVEERLALLPACYTGKIAGLSTAIPTEDRSLDAIVAGEFLEHLYPAHVDPTLCEFQRVLKIGGRLLMTTPNPDYLKNRLRDLSVYSVSHLTQHPAAILKHRLRSHGFSRVKIYGSGKVSRYLGDRFPWLSVYGSYLIIADKI